MRLPGINYRTPVQSFGKVAQAPKYTGADMLADVISTVGGVAQDVYNQESDAQATEAFQQWRTRKDENFTNFQAVEYDEQGQLVSRSWDEPDKKYADSNKAIYDSVKPILKTERANSIFNAKVAEADVAYKKATGLKIYNYQQENAKATLLNSAEKSTQAGLYNDARSDVESAYQNNLIDTDKYLAGMQEVDYREIVGGLDEKAQGVDLPENMNSFRKMVSSITTVNEKDKKAIISKAELATRDKQISDFSNALEVTEREQGPAAAYALGMKLIRDTAGATGESLGGDEASKIALMNKFSSITSRYKANTEKATAVSRRRVAMNSGADASQNQNPMIPNDRIMNGILGQEMDGSSKYIPGTGVEFAEVLKEDDLAKQDAIIAIVDEYHIIPDKFANSMEPIFNRAVSSSMGQEEGVKLGNFLNKLRRRNPVAFENMQGSKEMKDFAYMMGIYGDGEEGAAMAMRQIRANRGMSQAEKSDWKKVGSGSEFAKYFDDNIDSLIDKKYKEDTWGWDSSPDAKMRFKNKVNRLAKELLPNVGGRQEDAVRLAIEQLSGTFGVTNVNGKPEIVENPVERQGTNNGANKDWDTHAYISKMVEQTYPGVPMDEIRVEAVFPFDAEKPRYNIIRNNPDQGMFEVYLNEFEFDYRESDEAIEAEQYRLDSIQANNDLNRKKRLAQAHNEKYKGQIEGMFNPYDFTESLALKHTTEYQAFETAKQGVELWGPGWEKFGEGMFRMKELAVKPLEIGAESFVQYGEERQKKFEARQKRATNVQAFEEEQLLKGGG